jgi:hypothetical protein
MSTNATDDGDEHIVDEESEHAPEAEKASRYAELNIGDEEFVIYDRQNHQAWIQSSVTVTAGDFE